MTILFLAWLAFNAAFAAVLYVQRVWRPDMARKRKLKNLKLVVD